MSITYQFIDDGWEDTRQFHASIPHAQANLPVAIETEAAFVFRDISNQVFHKYPWPGTGDIATLTSYLGYLATEPDDVLDVLSAKGSLIRQIFYVLRLLSKAGRTRVNILEVGATLGENFSFIRNLIRTYGLDLDPYFVGIEVSPGLCNFARMVHHDDPNFHIIASDGSDLSRFPDQSFDLVICQGVANFTYAPKKTLSELIRVMRFATVLSLQITDERNPYYFTDGEKGWAHFIPTREELRQAWGPYFPLYDYKFSASPFHRFNSSAGGSDYYLGQDSAKLNIQMEWHTISRYPLVQSGGAQ